jgi:hypothetical protein
MLNILVLWYVKLRGGGVDRFRRFEITQNFRLYVLIFTKYVALLTRFSFEHHFGICAVMRPTNTLEYRGTGSKVALRTGKLPGKYATFGQ